MHSSKRRIIVHYHLFKNAGSSIDHLLKMAYGNRWVNHDPGTPPHLVSANELAEFILEHPDLRAMSSHMLVPPLPDFEVEICPIVLLREPITRIMSAYLFEWKKQMRVDQPVGPLSDYIQAKFEERRTSAIEDFQCLRLGNKDPSRRTPAPDRTDFEVQQDARDFLTSLPAFGLVDRFDESLDRFQQAYGQWFPEVRFESVAVNTTQSTSLSMDERYAAIEKEIGSELFDELVRRNQLDIRLYQYACGLFDAATEMPLMAAGMR